jgi:hypothetical protein
MKKREVQDWKNPTTNSPSRQLLKQNTGTPISAPHSGARCNTLLRRSLQHTSGTPQLSFVYTQFSPLYNAIMRYSLSFVQCDYALFSLLYIMRLCVTLSFVMRNSILCTMRLCATLSLVYVLFSPMLCVYALLPPALRRRSTPATIRSGDDPLRRRVYVA